MKNGTECPIMVTIKRASELTGVTYNCIRQLCLTNQITFIKASCKYLINLEEFIIYLNGGELAAVN